MTDDANDMVHSLRRPVVAIVGGAHAPEAMLAAAEAIGCGLVDAGCRIVTGGLTGIMRAAPRGGRTATGERTRARRHGRRAKQATSREVPVATTL